MTTDDRRYSRARRLTTDWHNVFHSYVDRQAKHPGYNLKEKPPKEFCTGSVYDGHWNGVGMAGFGTYIFPHNVQYDGMLNNSQFEGEGTLQYPKGQQIDGVWMKGKLVTWKYRFADGQEYERKWDYCQFPDRRFRICHQDGLRPACKELRTNDYVPRKIPEGCYDTIDGFYNPKIKCVISAIDLKKVIRIPTTCEEQWIMEHCRKAWDEPVGYKPDLYKYWTSGRRNEYYEEDSDSADDTASGSEHRDSIGSHCSSKLPYGDMRARSMDVSVGFKMSESSWATTD